MRKINADILIKELVESHKHHANNSREKALLDRDIQIVQEQPTVLDWMYLYNLPEQVYTDYQHHKYLVSLKGGGQVIATRDNGHWYGLWRWLRDEEVTGWMNLGRK